VKILVTGGAGYIGSAIAVECLDRGMDVVVLDDLSGGYDGVPEAASAYIGDVADREIIDRIMGDHPEIAVVVHCAAKTVVPASVRHPLEYYAENVGKTITLLGLLQEHGVERVVFSSSASVYRADSASGVSEDADLGPSSPYARTKLMAEQILADAGLSGAIRSIALRYFNPIGADTGLRTGLRNPSPTHVLGRIVDAWERGSSFTITGTDWPTTDGSGLRDFVHVSDLAVAHARAIEEFDLVATPDRPFLPINVGTGAGVTVRELVGIFGRVAGSAPHVVEGLRRPGDVAGGFAIVERARTLLGWTAEKSVEEGIADSLAWRRVWMASHE
jgi:UDP-glucose 4-epimerase